MTLESLSRLRQGIYRLFGAGLSYPTNEMISAAGGATTVLDGLDLFDYSFAPDVVEAAIALAEADVEELSIAYVALFEAGVAGAACPIHESAHRSNPRTGEVADLQSELKRTILRYGLRLDQGSEDMVDHISTEMHVMAMLCQQETELRAASRSLERLATNQLEFLDDHVLQWVPGFADLVQAKKRHAAYTTLASALRAFLAHERQLLPLLIPEPGRPT